MQFIDSHIHLQAYNIKDTPQIISNLGDMGFVKLVCPSTSVQDWEDVKQLADSYPQVIYPAYGLHPWYIDDDSSEWADMLYLKLISDGNAWVGECGLDRYKNPIFEMQRDVFATHIAFAKELSRPLIVHAVKANQWLEEFWKELGSARFVIHSFSGDVGFLRRVIKFGGYISFSPSILRSKNFDDLLVEVPINKIMLESDAPYQGKSSDIRTMIDLISKSRQMSSEELSIQLINNFKEFANV